MKFDPNKVAFGRHETFPLRFGWLTKGYDALLANQQIFTADEATVTLGVGRNMVNAIRFWLLAAGFIEPVPAPERGYQATELGKLVLDSNGYDPYLEDEATIWLIHWLIATNSQLATAWYWFFNQYHKPTFKSQMVATAITEFVKREVISKVSLSTVKSDMTILLRMYAGAKVSSKISLEDLLDSPLSSLDLIQRADHQHYASAIGEQEGLPIFILGFAILQLMQDKNLKEMPIEELLVSRNGYPAPGAVFRLSENALISKLEMLVAQASGIFEMRETGGIHQLYLLEDIVPNDLLAKHYREDDMQEEAA